MKNMIKNYQVLKNIDETVLKKNLWLILEKA